MDDIDTQTCHSSHRSVNNSQEVIPEHGDLYDDSASLEVDTQPSTGFTSKETPQIHVEEKKIPSKCTDHGEVMENTLTYHGQPEQHTAPCASENNAREEDPFRSQSQRGGAEKMIDSAVQADNSSSSYMAAKYSGNYLSTGIILQEIFTFFARHFCYA